MWRYWVALNFKWKIFSNFVAFSEYPNFVECLFISIISLDFLFQLNYRFSLFLSQDETKNNCCSKLSKLVMFEKNGHFEWK